MKLSSANVLRENKRVIRAINDPCDASCAMWFCCSNSVSDGKCTGYVNLNGKSKMLLDKNLSQDDLIYIQNCARMAQNECPEETRNALAQEVLRYIPHEEPQRESGFSYMAKCARGIQNAPPQEPEPETRSTEGFQGMLTAISRTEQTDNVTLTRAIDESQFPDFCNPMKCPPDYARHCSANRPENYGKRCVYKTLTTEEMKHPETRAIDNNKLKNLLDRLEIVEKELRNAENSPKNEHIIPSRPNFCKPKNPNGEEE